MDRLIYNFIFVLHIIFFMFVVLTPFFGSNYFKLLHIIVIPFIVFHWLVNDNTCAVVLFEKKIREVLMQGSVDKSSCFSANLVEPIYDFNKNYNQFSLLIYILTLSLWSVSVGNIYWQIKNNKIKKLKDLFN